MHVRISYAIYKLRDFKICLKCGRLNWYENESCIDCGNEQGFRKARKSDIVGIVEAFISSGHFCDDCEISV